MTSHNWDQVSAQGDFAEMSLAAPRSCCGVRISGYTVLVLNHTLSLVFTAKYDRGLREDLGLPGKLEEASR